MTPRPPLDEVLALFQGIVAVPVRTTTGPGAGGGLSLVDIGLAGSGVGSFISMCAIIYPGDPIRIASADITAFDNVLGEVTFTPGYKGGVIPAGVPYMILTHRFVPAEVAALAASLGLMADAATADDLSDVTTTSAQAKLRRLLLRFSANAFSANVNPGGAAATDVETMVQDLANVLAGAGITTFPAAAVPANGISLAEVLRQIYNDVIALAGANIFHEQPAVAVSFNVGVAWTDVFLLNAANTRYQVRSLRLKCANPGADTVRVALYELMPPGPALNLIDFFDITAANFADYFSLMDMFGLPHLAGDNLQVRMTIFTAGPGPYAVKGEYSYATAT